MDFGKLKLIIWDLDDTFWDGTLSEGGVHPISKNIHLVRSLTDRGIINTICSKNDPLHVEKELKGEGCEELFVFKSIDWSPKGQRIATLIKDMGLQPKHCLFIDDNPVNLNEAKHYSSDLNVSEPSIIEELIKYVESTPVSDSDHKRLSNYKVLEQKQQAKASASDNLEFLYDSNTQVEIYHDCLAELDRIYELVNRTNQLNFTKVRSTKEELTAMLKDEKVEAGYVKVRDKYGDYGIIGFYAMKDCKLLHFLFSCRTIGQGVEQYVYAKLGYPQLDVVGEVVNDVHKGEMPAWINQAGFEEATPKKKEHHKVIFKGACDLMNMSVYLTTENVTEEFAYIGKKRKNNIEHMNHSVNMLSFPFVPKEQRQSFVNELIFNDEEMFDTSIYDDDVDIIFFGTMIEPNLGIYRNRMTGSKIAFGESSHSLTDPKQWPLYIRNEIFTSSNQFTEEWLRWFSERYEYMGSLTPEEIVENYKLLLEKLSNKAKVCFLLGSEIPFEKETNTNYFGREKIYKKINDLIKEWSKTNNRVLYISFNDYIKGQEDFTNNINHFQRRVYYAAATKANEYISALTGDRLVQRSRWYLRLKVFADEIGKTGFYQTSVWRFIRKPYVWLRSKIT